MYSGNSLQEVESIVNEFSRKCNVKIEFNRRLRTCSYNHKNDVLKVNINMLINAVRNIFNSELKAIHYILLHEYYHRVLIKSMKNPRILNIIEEDLTLNIAYNLVQDYIIDHLLINNSWYLKQLLSSYRKTILDRKDFRLIQLFYIKFIRNPVNLYMPYHTLASYSIRNLLRIEHDCKRFTDVELKFTYLLRDIYEVVDQHNWLECAYLIRQLIEKILPIKKIIKIIEHQILNMTM